MDKRLAAVAARASKFPADDVADVDTPEEIPEPDNGVSAAKLPPFLALLGGGVSSCKVTFVLAAIAYDHKVSIRTGVTGTTLLELIKPTIYKYKNIIRTCQVSAEFNDIRPAC